MAQESRIEVINRDGWRKEFKLNQSIAFVGSQTGVDIVLPEPEIVARHLQFVPSTVNRLGYRVINLSSAEVQTQVRSSSGMNTPKSLASRGSVELSDGDSVILAGYTLVYYGGAQTSNFIQARVELPMTRLELETPLDGVVVIKNAGDKAGVQFVVEVQGWDTRFIQIEPGPVLFPQVEKRCSFRLIHPRQPLPPAGEQTITFVVTAPDAYPGESAAIAQAINIAPFYAHKVRVVPLDQQMA
jgi:hypothetical protein